MTFLTASLSNVIIGSIFVAKLTDSTSATATRLCDRKNDQSKEQLLHCQAFAKFITGHPQTPQTYHTPYQGGAQLSSLRLSDIFLSSL